ncbi:MAG: hypothetical protein JSV96_15395 [Candidatus Aminicenantes bacterium]|nr:MAG: hypothetical protein JSV96_15395 [Candidatus Aminicenantes bacterium]
MKRKRGPGGTRDRSADMIRIGGAGVNAEADLTGAAGLIDGAEEIDAVKAINGVTRIGAERKDEKIKKSPLLEQD